MLLPRSTPATKTATASATPQASSRGVFRGQGRPRARRAQRSARHLRPSTRTPEGVPPDELGPVARELRWTARHLARVGALSGHEKFATAALLVALASLVAEIGAWQHMRGRVHQAAAAHGAAKAISIDGAGKPT